jgi:hypothetical protein
MSTSGEQPFSAFSDWRSGRGPVRWTCPQLGAVFGQYLKGAATLGPLGGFRTVIRERGNDRFTDTVLRPNNTAAERIGDDQARPARPAHWRIAYRMTGRTSDPSRARRSWRTRRRPLKEAADGLRYRALGKSMAVRTKDLKDVAI